MSNNDDDTETPNESFNYDLSKLDLGPLSNKISRRFEYAGCFTSIDNYFNEFAPNSNEGAFYKVNIKADDCELFCAKHFYLWIKRGAECICSGSLEDLHLIDEAYCDVKCQHRDKNGTCGSQTHSDIFSVYRQKYLLSKSLVFPDLFTSTTTKPTTTKSNSTNDTTSNASLSLFMDKLLFKNDSYHSYSICTNYSNLRTCFIFPIYLSKNFQSREFVWSTLLAVFLMVLLFLIIGSFIYLFHKKIYKIVQRIREQLKSINIRCKNSNTLLRTLFVKRIKPESSAAASMEARSEPDQSTSVNSSESSRVIGNTEIIEMPEKTTERFEIELLPSELDLEQRDDMTGN